MVSNHFPELFHFVNSVYVSSSDLTFGSFIIQSEEGLQQGDPLGPFLFSLAIHHILDSLRSDLVIGYLDDITLAGEASVVAEDLISLETQASSIGLSMNRGKCEVCWLGEMSKRYFQEKDINLHEVDLVNLSLLGAPLMPGSGVTAALEVKLGNLQLMAERLTLLPSHDALYLLRHVISMPSLLYTLRKAPCMGNAVRSHYDELVRKTFSLSMNIDLSDDAWLQASL